MDNEKIHNYIPTLPESPGTYLIVLELDKPVACQVGKLGSAIFPSGKYGYIGSALGTGGLSARLLHHLRPSPRPHWHIDWLKPYLIPEAILYRIGLERLECTWRGTIQDRFPCKVPLRGFGASDCRNHCPAHLLYVGDDHPERIYQVLSAEWKDIQYVSLHP